MQWLLDFWNGLSEIQRTIVFVLFAVVVLMILGSFIFAGTDYSGFGDWIKSWF